MKYIKKETEPISLTRHRSQSHANYKNYKEKDDLRKNLLDEQGYICCYCMQGIRIKKGELLELKMKIEHWKPQSKFPELQLDYNNLLGACLGNEGYPKHLQPCDTKKGEDIITVNPTQKNCDFLIKFSTSGEIYSEDENVAKDLNDTLNLNMDSLVKNRKRVLDDALQNFYMRHPRTTWTKAILEREITKWSPKHGPYKAYGQIIIYYLKKKLAKLV